MADFKIIETQEELDQVISSRLERERKSAEKRYEGFEEYRDKAGKYDELVSRDLEGTVKRLEGELEEARKRLEASEGESGGYRTRAEAAEKSLMQMKVAGEAGLPMEFATRLAGNTEEEMKKDAEGLSRYILRPTAPLYAPEKAAEQSGASSAYAKLSARLKNG